MRRWAISSLLFSLLTIPTSAASEPAGLTPAPLDRPPAPPAARAPERFDSTLLVDDGRTRPGDADTEDMLLQLHGELQLRFEHKRDLALNDLRHALTLAETPQDKATIQAELDRLAKQ